MEINGVITCQDVRRRYGGKAKAGYEAVGGVSFAVRRGELFALLGTNGAGKTSTMELLEGLAVPTGGSVQVLGHDPNRERRLIRSRIGIQLQESGIPPDLTVTETMRMWAGTLSEPRPFDEVLAELDIEHRADVAVRQLSGGERRRLDLALAVLGGPDVLFLDEPTTGLDPESRQRCWVLLQGLLQSGVTIVLTTHYLEEAETLADRIAIMHRGRVAACGTVAELAAAKPAEIRFRIPGGLGISVPDLPAAVSTDRGADGDVVVRSADLQRSMTALMQWATVHGVSLANLRTGSASLHSTFLEIATGTAQTAGNPEVAL